MLKAERNDCDGDKKEGTKIANRSRSSRLLPDETIFVRRPALADESLTLRSLGPSLHISPAVMNPSTTPQILAIDDDELTLSFYRGFARKFGYGITEARNAGEALSLANDTMAVALVDLQLPDMGGLQLITEIQQRFPLMQMIIVSSSSSFSDAVAAIRLGVFDFVQKPVVFSSLHASVQRSLDRYQDQFATEPETDLPEQENESGVEVPVERVTLKSSWEQDLARIASMDGTVLLTGETGTGKSRAARFIHEHGSRAHGPLVSVNCASLPAELIECELFGHKKGAFTGAIEDRIGRAELAEGGTLFLDEVGDLPLELQPKLLTFLQDRTAFRVGSNVPYRVNCRVIAATHRDLRKMCQLRQFREDLYFRLDVLSVRIPPLRERLTELPSLIEAILTRLRNRYHRPGIRISQGFVDRLFLHFWPGNIRELENVLERSIGFCVKDLLTADDVRFTSLMSENDADAGEPINRNLAGMTLDDVEKKAIVETLTFVGGNKAKAARVLGISEKSIYNKMKRLGVDQTAGR